MLIAILNTDHYGLDRHAAIVVQSNKKSGMSLPSVMQRCADCRGWALLKCS